MTLPADPHDFRQGTRCEDACIHCGDPLDAVLKAHAEAAGDLCIDDGAGGCSACGVSLDECESCEGVGYHRDRCERSE